MSVDLWACAAHLYARVAGPRLADGIEVRIDGDTGGVWEDGEQTDWLDAKAIPGTHDLLGATALAVDAGYLGAMPVRRRGGDEWVALRVRLGPVPDARRDVWCTLTGQPASRALLLVKGMHGYLGDAAVEQLVGMLAGFDVGAFRDREGLPPCFVTGGRGPRVYAELTAVSVDAVRAVLPELNARRTRVGQAALVLSCKSSRTP